MPVARASSLRARLSRSLVIGCVVLLLVTGLVLDRLIESWLQAEFDRALEAKARALVTLTQQQEGVVELHFADEFMPEFSRAEDPEYFQLWLDDGEVLERSRSLGEGALDRHGDRSPGPRRGDVVLPDGARGRQIQIDFVPQVEDHDDGAGPAVAEGEDADADDVALDPTLDHPGLRAATLVVARGREDLDRRIVWLRLVLSATAAILISALALLVGATVRSGLRPLAAISGQVAALGAESLGQRIDVEPPVELAPLVVKLNELLARLQSAFERERRFSSDVAHELRTPIAELRNLADVGGRWPGDRAAVRRFFLDVRQIAAQMEAIVAQLLALARTDAGLESVVLGRVELATLIAEVWRGLEPTVRSRDCTLRAEVPEPLWLETDPAKLERILQNLLGNAASHAPPGEAVSVTARRDEGRLAVEVSNPAPDLTAADLPRLFDRFWRRDEARSAADHSGLGLSLVKAFCDLLAIRLEVDLDAQGTFTVSLAFPADAADGAA